MLTIQPKVTNSIKLTPAFGQRQNKESLQEIAEDANFEEVGDEFSSKRTDLDEENDYNDTRAFWEAQKKNYEKVAEDVELPQTMRKGAKFFAVISNAAIDAIAVFWAGKKLMGGAETLLKTPTAKRIMTNTKNVTTAPFRILKNVATTALGAFQKTDLYKTSGKKLSSVTELITDNKLANGIKGAYDAVAENAFVKTIASAFGHLNKKVGTFFTNTSERIAGITGEQYKTAVAGTLAAGSGIAGAVDAASGNQED